MNFGVRLPGPFRMGISSKGRVNAGVTLGPFSVSSGVGGRRAAPDGVMFRGTLDDVIASAVADGFAIKGRSTHSAFVQRGWWTGISLTVVRGGILARRATTAATVLTWLGVAALGIALCIGMGS